MSRGYIRESRVHCGRDYQDVSVFPMTDRDKRQRRNRKEVLSSPAQKNLNDRNSKRYTPRRMEKLARLPEDCEEVRAFWEKHYPQWHIYHVEKDVHPESGRSSWFLEMKRKADAGSG